MLGATLAMISNPPGPNPYDDPVPKPSAQRCPKCDKATLEFGYGLAGGGGIGVYAFCTTNGCTFFQKALYPYPQMEPESEPKKEIEMLSRTWNPIEIAPKDREIIVYCPPVHGLGDIVCRCTWHPDAGFCVDELRSPTHWIDKPE